MRRIDIMRRAGRNLKKSKLRTILTALAIAVGSTTITLALAAGKGGRAYVEFMSGKIGDKNSLSVTRKPQETSPVADQYKPKKVDETAQEQSEKEIEKWRQDSILTNDDLQKISKVNGVRKVNPSVDASSKSVKFENSDEFLAETYSKNDEREVELSAGKLSQNNQIPKGKVVIPKSYVSAFGLKNPQDALGKTIEISFPNEDRTEIFWRKFEILAVDAGDTETTFHYRNSFVISNEDAVEIAKKKTKNGVVNFYMISVNTDEKTSAQDLKNSIKNLNPERYQVETFADENSAVNQAVNFMQIGLMGFGFLVIFASVFGVINTQYISVLERTSQIGLMKSLGAKKSEIAKLFRYESAIIGFLGGVIGVLIAWGFTFLNPTIRSLIHFNLDLDILQMDWQGSAILVLGLVVIAVISGYLPARKAAKMNPIEALRTE